MRRFVTISALITCAAGVTIVGAGQQTQQGVGQTPSGLPLTPTIRERGSSVTPAYEGWYYDKDGTTRALVGYFNRNTKQEFDIPPGPNNSVEPGGPDQGQPTHFMTGRQWGVFSVKLPKDLGDKKLTWTIVTNGFTNRITLHTKPDYIVEPYEDAASKNTPPKFRFRPDGPVFTGPANTIAEKYTATVGTPLALTVWVTDEGAKVNVPEGGRGRGRAGAARGGDAAAGRGGDAAAGRGGDAAAAPARGGDAAAAAGRGGDAAAAAGAQGRGRAGRGAAGAELLFGGGGPAAIWSKFRGPGEVKFDNVRPKLDAEAGGKGTTNATFSAPGEYILRVEGTDSTGSGGGGFQCCWSTAHVSVTVK